ncbi:hypothetical protein [Enterococcus malodoratus]|uniref:hypothetical protein n=1 Tax=Enterococcus malodoratus TaxID=71451 RepID=UPI0039B0FB2B
MRDKTTAELIELLEQHERTAAYLANEMKSPETLITIADYWKRLSLNVARLYQLEVELLRRKLLL